MFHRYSVDQHTLFTIQNLENIPQAPVCDRLRSVFRGEPSLETVKLALLLHDLGKRAEDHHTQEDPYARVWAILERLGLEKLTEKIAFLVRRHLLMSETAQRHNFSEPETLKRFCRITGSRKNLEMLYLLTYADISGVGPGVWSDWKDKILLELFESAEQYFIKGDALFMSDEARLDAMVKQIAKIGAASYEESEVQDFLAKAPERYFRNATPETVLADMDLLENLDETPIVFRYAPNPGDETGKITLAASERLGFFSIIAGALAAKSVNIVEAQIYTFDGRVALDTITVEGANLSIFSDKHSLDRFTKEIIELLDGKKDMKEMVARRTRYLQPKAEDDSSQIEPQAVLLNHLSDDFSVVEIWAPDRVGLLYDITRTLARLKLDIHSAKISNEGRIAIDVFYITSEAGAKIEDDTRAKEITDSLISAIRSPAGID